MSQKAPLSISTLLFVSLASVAYASPVMPHITEELFHKYFKTDKHIGSIHVSEWPKANSFVSDEKAHELGELGIRIIEQARKFKSENGVSLKAPIKASISAKISQEDFNQIIEDIKGTIRAEEIIYLDGEESFSFEIIQT